MDRNGLLYSIHVKAPSGGRYSIYVGLQSDGQKCPVALHIGKVGNNGVCYMNNWQCNIDHGGTKQLCVNLARINIQVSRLMLLRDRSIVVNVMNRLRLNNHSSFDARPITSRKIQLS